jgi:glycosyltransferase involved in cell wall biosynthesis
MHEAPRISVVIPVFNGQEYLATTLDSVAAQTEERWECVVVDDGSVDDSHALALEYATRDPRFRALRQDNSGASAARNTGYRATDGQTTYVTFMDSDDVWLPHALTTLVDRLEASSAAVGSHGLAEFIDAAGRPLDPGSYAQRGRHRLALQGRRFAPLPDSAPTDFNVLINGNVLFPPGLLIARRTVYDRAGPFDESFNGPEDWDMLIRLSRHGHLEFVNAVLLLYRRHENNLGAADTVPEQAWRVRCKAFYSPENSAEQQKLARRGWRAYQAMLMRERLRSAWEGLRSGRVLQAVTSAARVPVFVVRYIRGRPLPRVDSAPASW